MNVPIADGLLVLDKPGGMTSRAVVDRVLRWFPRRTRIGHTGTLDPLATGVLVLCLGGATRLSEYVQLMNKTYRTRLLLGARSDSDDADGTITPVAGTLAPTAAAVEACAAAFVGVIEQVPPAYSAAKVSGRRAYDLARRGEEVMLRPRSVRIYAVQILDYAYPYLELKVDCGKGTYIRSLARDLGERLGCGALVQSLRRTRVGPFTAEEALTLDSNADTVRAQVMPAETAVAELPRLVLPDNDLKRLCQGQKVLLESRSVSEGAPALACASGSEECCTAVFDSADRLAAIAVFDPQRKTLHPAKVLQSK
ncbi:MAG TPA: tRNA pseudouridine(55) synthase TruB [Gemmataceae bacterium]|nr:tRNA pseudouridine(55) synthase TruB [Gemmataceae bacterium]